MNLELLTTENKVDNEINKDSKELWKILFIKDFKYQKNEKDIWYLSARIVYLNNITNKVKRELIDVNLIYDRIIGRVYDKDRKLLNINLDKESEKIDFRIDKSDLGKVSKMLCSYQEFDLINLENQKIDNQKIDNFKNTFLLPNRLFDELHYATVHLLKSDKEGIDYFILPSYEVLRYFFLKGSRLNKFLFKKFLLSRKDFANNNNELYVKLESNEGGVKRYFLMTKQGLSDSEYKVICRMAYVENAHECVEKLRDSLLRSSQRKIEYELKTLRTIIPQDEPLDVYCSGKRFHYNHKNYFLIDEIHQTREHIPIKDVELIYFSDRRRNPKEGEEGKETNGNGNKNRTVKRTKPTPESKFTSEELGNDAMPAEIQINNPSSSFFGDCDDFNLIKHGKIDSGNSYGGTNTVTIPADILSLAEEIDKNSKNGRANTNSSDDSENDFIKERREVFYKALTALRFDNMIVSFFQIESGKIEFIDTPTLVEPKKENLQYKTVICQIQLKYNGELFYVYIVKSDYLDDEVSRYALFNYKLFNPYDLSKLKKIYDDNFSKKGIKIEKNEDPNHLRYTIQYHNQSNLDYLQLKEKIKREINKKIGIV